MDDGLSQHIKQSDFRFNLGDNVVIIHANKKNTSLNGFRGKVTQRGYMDSIHPDQDFPTLYCVHAHSSEDFVPGVPSSWLEPDFTQNILEDT